MKYILKTKIKTIINIKSNQTCAWKECDYLKRIFHGKILLNNLVFFPNMYNGWCEKMRTFFIDESRLCVKLSWFRTSEKILLWLTSEILAWKLESVTMIGCHWCVSSS